VARGHHLGLKDGAVHQADVPPGADRARLAGETVQGEALTERMEWNQGCPISRLTLVSRPMANPGQLAAHHRSLAPCSGAIHLGIDRRTVCSGLG